MKKIIWISPAAPYDTVPHAGGKIENYYIKKINGIADFEVRLLSFCKSEEVTKLDFEDYGIGYDIYVRGRGGLINEAKRGIAWASKAFVTNKFAGLVPVDLIFGLHKMLKNIECGYEPNIVILQWTEMVFFIEEIKTKWPNAKIIAVEEDVSYLGQVRKAEFNKNPLLKQFFMYKAKKVKRLEIKFLNIADLVIFNNKKDMKLAKEDGFYGKEYVWAPFFQRCKKISSNILGNKVVFYGAMNREENWRSVIWFVENVMPLLAETDIVFEVIGGNPDKQLFNYENNRIKIRGFVDDISEELGNALCLVAPLVLGAGIKIKIIEAMYMGLPVLTNDIGIEGIPAENGKEFFRCVTPEDYANQIKLLQAGQINMNEIGINAHKLIKENFDFEKDAIEIIELIRSI